MSKECKVFVYGAYRDTIDTFIGCFQTLDEAETHIYNEWMREAKATLNELRTKKEQGRMGISDWMQTLIDDKEQMLERMSLEAYEDMLAEQVKNRPERAKEDEKNLNYYEDNIDKWEKEWKIVSQTPKASIFDAPHLEIFYPAYSQRYKDGYGNFPAIIFDPTSIPDNQGAESFGAEDLAYCPRCGLNPNDNQPLEQQHDESDHVKEYGVCNYCMEELIDEGGEEVALQFDEGTFSFNGESFGAEPELIGGPCEICGEDLFRDYDDSMGDVCLSCYYEERSKQDDEGSEYDGWLLNFAESFGADSSIYVRSKDYSNEIVEKLNPILINKIGKTFVIMNTNDDSWMFRLTDVDEKLDDDFVEYGWEEEVYAPHKNNGKYVGFDWKEQGFNCFHSHRPSRSDALYGFNIPLANAGYEMKRMDNIDPSEYKLVKSENLGAESFGAEDDNSTTCEDCGVKIGYDEAFDWEGLDRCEDCYDYWMMKDRQNYGGDETDCISCGYSISPNDSRFELVDGLCPDCKDTESFGAELADYPHPMSDRQKYRIRKLGGRIDKAMSRSQASQYIKSLMRIDPLHAETSDCSACQGWGWNEDLNMVCDADGCVGGWVIPKKPSLLERGLELGAGVGMGMAGVAILFGVLGGTVGFAAEEMKKRRD